MEKEEFRVRGVVTDEVVDFMRCCKTLDIDMSNQSFFEVAKLSCFFYW